MHRSLAIALAFACGVASGFAFAYLIRTPARTHVSVSSQPPLAPPGSSAPYETADRALVALDLPPDAPIENSGSPAPAEPAESTPETYERYPDAPGTPGQLPFASGSLEERIWLLRRALRDLDDLGTGDHAIEKAGYEILGTAVGGILDAQGRGIELPPGKQRIPTAKPHERVFKSQTKWFVFERFEFPEYDTFLTAMDADHDWKLIGDRTEWLALVRARADDAITLMSANLGN